MKFLLLSRGPLTAAQETELRKLVGRDFVGLKLLFCITASDKDGGDKTWIVDNLDKFKSMGFAIDICDLGGADRISLLERFRWADVFYFEGGDTLWLRDAIKSSGVEKFLPELLEKRVWIGVSAGGCVLSPVLFSSCAEWFKEKPGNPTEGLGLVDFQFLPHLNSRHFPENTVSNIENVRKNLIGVDGRKLYSIDDFGAISVDGDSINVFGGESFWI